MDALGWAVGLVVVWVVGIAWSRKHQARRAGMSEQEIAEENRRLDPARVVGAILLLAVTGAVCLLYVLELIK